ncbi:hypothetical protein RRG08_033055 [Elysia crispata]|uniref:HTH CENPB-type domain-containing protein n=1 Tax=Elysia crispata TaxID=231223 RepID=A0AAE1DTJ5_9GAST|nr:hypothetical protein RRG08_033055 [Elysia crispata]
METKQPVEAVGCSNGLCENDTDNPQFKLKKNILETPCIDVIAEDKCYDQIKETKKAEENEESFENDEHQVLQGNMGTKPSSCNNNKFDRSERILEVLEGDDTSVRFSQSKRSIPEDLPGSNRDGVSAFDPAQDSSNESPGNHGVKKNPDLKPSAKALETQPHDAALTDMAEKRNCSLAPETDDYDTESRGPMIPMCPTKSKETSINLSTDYQISEAGEDSINLSNAKNLSTGEHDSNEPSNDASPNSLIKLEIESSSNGAAKEEKLEVEEEGKQINSVLEDADKKKDAILRMLNIPSENSASITEEELKILTKYVFMNPGISERLKKTGPLSEENITTSTSSTRGRRRYTARKAKSVQANTRERQSSTRLASKRAIRRSAPPVSDSEEEEQEEESGKEQSEKRPRLTLEEKLKVLKLKREGLTNVKIAGKLGLTNSRVWRILQKKKELLVEAKHGKRKKRHRRTKKEMEASRRNAIISHEDVHDVESNFEEEMKEEENEENSDDEAQQKTKGYKTRKDLTLEDRRKVIETLEASKTKVKDLARRFGVSTSSISRIKKNKEVMKLKLATGDLCGSLRRWRDCKDPDLDKVLTKWYRAFEAQHSTGETGGAVSVTNTLLREKAHDLALIMGTNYFASDNWIHRWKNRHNIKSRMNLISDREVFQNMDATIDISLILDALGKQQFKMDEAKREALRQQKTKPEEFLICEHCGVLISSRRKRLDHQPGCPGALSRKDLTLHEKASVVKQLEEPGVTMVSLARKYGVSTSAISRIHKSRVEILARVAEGGKSLARRKRDRPSKEPEVERLLCDWYREQRDMGIHATGSAIRDKARDIARVLGKDFWPSESWVFRWRHRHNMTGNPSELYDDEEEEEEDEGIAEDGGVLDPATGELCNTQAADPAASTVSLVDPSVTAGESASPPLKPKRSRLPKLIMCEKCGCVSSRKKNSRPVRIRHAKGCPDIRQRNEMTYEDRAKMVHALEEPGATLSSVARQFGVSVSSMSRIRQRKNEILSFTGSKGESKRIRSCKEPEIAQMLFQYYIEKKAEGIHINGPKLKERASMLAREMGREFKVSSGWLGRWRHRYNVFSTPKPPSEKIRDQELSQPSKSRKKQQRRLKTSEDGEVLTSKSDAGTVQVASAPYEGDGTSLGGQIVIDEALEPVPAPMPSSAATLQSSMFLHRSFQSPWDLVTQQQQQHQHQHQQQNVGSWVKDLMPAAIATSMGDHESVTYTYAEASGAVLPKQLFHPHPHPSHHNMFEPFPSAAVGYHMALPHSLETSGNLIGRDFLKDDGDDSVVSAVKSNNNASVLSSGHQGLALPHPSHLPHPLLAQPQHTSLPHPTQTPSSSSSAHHHHPHHPHHLQLGQHHSRQHLPPHHHHQQQQQQQSSQHQALHLHNNPTVASSSSTSTPEEDPDQQRHLMDALKMMSNFAARKSLGDQVQSALRTIEMTMKNNPRKSSSTRGSYPNM